MNEVELVFYGERRELESSVLQKIGVIHYRPATELLKGLFAVEKRYGSEVRKPLASNILGADSDADWIIFRYLNAEEEKTVRENKLNKKIYVLLHNYYSFHRLYESLLKENINQYSLVVDRFNNEIKSIHDVSVVVKTKNYFNIIKPKAMVQKKDDQKSFDFSLWIMLIGFAKILLNPVNELNRYSILMKYSQARGLIRLLELISFVVFLVRWTWIFSYRIAVRLFYGIYGALGLSKVVSIKAGFLTRHMVLMSAYKIYGGIVNVLAFLYRVFRLGFLTPVYYWLGGYLFKGAGLLWKYIGVPIYNFIRFSVRHVVLMVTVKIYGVLFDIVMFLNRIWKLYFFVPAWRFLGEAWRFLGEAYRIWKLYFLVPLWRLLGETYRVAGVPIVNFIRFNLRHVFVMISAKAYGFLYDTVMWCDRWIRLPVQNFLKFTVRHYFLMFAFKTYGLVVDTVLFIHRIVKLYLLYPFFKIYWFVAFQYKKRIKKYFV